MAERLNGILKGEYFLDRHFKTKTEARKAVKEAIWIYNHRRLHYVMYLVVDQPLVCLKVAEKFSCGGQAILLWG